jgi:hypothetical protein
VGFVQEVEKTPYITPNLYARSKPMVAFRENEIMLLTDRI